MCRGAQRGLGPPLPGLGGGLGERARLLGSARSRSPPAGRGSAPPARRLLWVGGVPYAPWAGGVRSAGEGGRRGAVFVPQEERPHASESPFVPAGAPQAGPRFAGKAVVSPSCCPVENTKSRTLDQNVVGFIPPAPPTFNVGFKEIKSDVIRGLRIASSTFPGMCKVLGTAFAMCSCTRAVAEMLLCSGAPGVPRGSTQPGSLFQESPRRRREER